MIGVANRLSRIPLTYIRNIYARLSKRFKGLDKLIRLIPSIGNANIITKEVEDIIEKEDKEERRRYTKKVKKEKKEKII